MGRKKSNQTNKYQNLFITEMLVARIENDNGRVIEGGRITLRCEGRGYPMPTLTWEKMGRPLATGGNVYISSDGRLVIREATLDDTGTYSCIVANSEEKIETSTSVQVVPKGKCKNLDQVLNSRFFSTLFHHSFALSYEPLCYKQNLSSGFLTK